MKPSVSAPLTPLTQVGRVLSKGISKVLRPESANFFQVAAHRVYIPHLPETFEAFRIVQLSDIHFYEFSYLDYYQRIVDTVNDLHPDMVVTTGDIIHYGETHLPMGEYFLSQLKAPYGKWACMGNHDYSDDYRGQALQRMKQSAGFEMLVNEAVAIEKQGKRLWLSGIDDYKMSSPDVDAAYDTVESQTAHLTLVHNPAFSPKLVKHRKAPDMILSGHTHGGQIKHFIVNWLQKNVFHHPYQYGWFELGEQGRSRLYVTSGVGSASMCVHTPQFDFSLYPFRINTTPEIAVFELTSQPPEPQAVSGEGELLSV